MPPHQVYIETHLGGGSVLRHKKPAILNIGIDIDPVPLCAFADFPANFQFYPGDAVSILGTLPLAADTLIYADPPYLPETRRSARRVYRHEYSRQDHLRLLRFLRTVNCMVLISGYESEVYNETLRGWRRESFVGTSHTGCRVETVWMNYEPRLLHDCRFIGGSFRGREVFRRLRVRWRQRFASMPKVQQQAVLTDLLSTFLSEFSDCDRSSATELLLTEAHS